MGKGINRTKVRIMYKTLLDRALKNTLSPNSRWKLARPTHSVTPGFTSWKLMTMVLIMG